MDEYDFPMTEAERAQIHLDMSVKAAFDALDEVMAMAADPTKKHLVIKERLAMHQLVSRTQLIASWVDAALDQPGKIKMVVNNA